MRGGYAERKKQEVWRLKQERDADHAALRTAVQLSGHLVLGPGTVASAPSAAAGSGEREEEKGKGKQKGKGKPWSKKGAGGKKGGDR